MKELINLARGFSQQFECALVYGIANVAQLDNLFKVNAKQFVIVEADPGVFSKLEEWHSTLPETAPTVNCYHAALSYEDAPTTLLHQASQPGYSSTAKPNQIKRFRPGLTFSSVSVPAKKLSYFTDKYAVSANQHNIALFNCNGAEHQILSDSTSQLFSSVIVKTTTKPLFGEKKESSELLLENGYSACAIRSLQPATLNYLLLRSPEWQVQEEELLKVKAGNIKQTAEINELHQNLERYNEIESSKKELLKQIDLEKEVSDKLRTSLDCAERELESIRQQQDECLEQIVKLKQERDDEAHWHAEHKKWAEGLQAEKSKLETQLASQVEISERKEAELEQLKLSIADEQATTSESQSTIGLLTRQNCKLQSDLDDLRKRYAEKLESEEKLTELLRELHDKLQKAATFYHQLEKQYPELSLSLEEL